MHYPEPLPERGSVSDCDAVHEDAGAADSERSCSKTKDEKVSREQSCKASGTSAMSRKCETHETTDQPSWFKNMFAWGWPTAKEGPRMTKQESAGPAHTWPRTHTEGGINAAKVPVIAVVPADASASTAVVADMSTQTGGQSPPRRDKGDSSRRSSTGNDGGESESAPAQSNASHSPGPDVTLARRQLRVPSDGKDEENMISDKGGAKESNSEGKSTEGHATNAEGQPSSTMVEGANVCEEDKSTASTGPQNVEVRHITASQELQGTSSVTKEPVADKSTPQAPHENEALKNSFRRPEAHHLSTDPLVPSPVRPTEHRMSADHNKFSPDGEDLSQTEQDHPEGNKDMLVSAAITHDPHVPSPKPPQSHRLSTGDPLVPPAGDLLGPGAGERHSLQRDPMVPLDSLWFRPDAPPAPLTHQSDGGDAGGNDGSAGAEVRVEEGTRSLPRKKGRNRDRKGGKGGDGVSGVNRAFTLRGRPY